MIKTVMPVYVLKLLLPVHLLSAIAIALLFLGLSAHWLWWTLLGWFLFGCLGVEIGIHRLFSHRAFSVSPPVEKTLALLGCFGGQWAPLQWVALHNGYHHRSADTEKDIHSPRRGLWHAYLGWYFKVQADDIKLVHARALFRCSYHRFLQKHYLTIVWATIITTAVIDWRFALFFFIVPMFLTINQTNLSNVLGHVGGMGYRNHNLPDDSVNVPWFSLFSWGLSLHNNHHAAPENFNFAERGWEFDPSAPIIRLIVTIDRLINSGIGRLLSKA